MRIWNQFYLYTLARNCWILDCLKTAFSSKTCQVHSFPTFGHPYKLIYSILLFTHLFTLLNVGAKCQEMDWQWGEVVTAGNTNIESCKSKYRLEDVPEQQVCVNMVLFNGRKLTFSSAKIENIQNICMVFHHISKVVHMTLLFWKSFCYQFQWVKFYFIFFFVFKCHPCRQNPKKLGSMHFIMKKH